MDNKKRKERFDMAKTNRRKPTVIKPRHYLGDLRRKDEYISQMKVARELEMDCPTYNQIEGGKQGHNMNAEKLYALSKIFHVDIGKIVKLEVRYQRDLKRANGAEIEYDPEIDDERV